MVQTNSVGAVIVAAGRGTRMGTKESKQYLMLQDKPIVIHTLEVFDRHPLITEIVLVTGEQDVERAKAWIDEYGITTQIKIIPGGAEMMLWSFLNHVDRERLEPAVVFLEPGPFQEEVAALGLETYSAPIGRLRSPRRVGRAVRQLAHIFRTHDPDLVVNWVAKAQLYGAPASKRGES